MKMLALLFAVVGVLGAQEFEVASIRPAKDDGHRHNDTSQGRWVTHNLTLKRLISMAFDVDEDAVVGGPTWVGTDSYDINAKISTPKWTREQLRDMQKSMLADRFQLTVHREPRRIAGYALTVAKSGSKLGPARPDEGDSDFSSGSNT